jgi:hypothetical protein
MLRWLPLVALVTGCGDASKRCRVDTFALSDGTGLTIEIYYSARGL